MFGEIGDNSFDRFQGQNILKILILALLTCMYPS